MPVQPFDEDDVGAMLSACTSVRDVAAILFLLDTGVRASEFCGLCVCDLDLQRRTCQIRNGKGRKSRTVVFGEHTLNALAAHMDTMPALHRDSPVWRNSRTGRCLTTSGLRQLLNRVASRAGVSSCHPHRFRHSFGVWSVRNGMDPFRLQRLMGHVKLDTLNRYLCFTADDLREAHDRHGPTSNLDGARIPTQ